MDSPLYKSYRYFWVVLVNVSLLSQLLYIFLDKPVVHELGEIMPTLIEGLNASMKFFFFAYNRRRIEKILEIASSGDWQPKNQDELARHDRYAKMIR